MSLGVVVLLSVLGTFMNSAGLLLQKQGVMLSGGRKFSYLKKDLSFGSAAGLLIGLAAINTNAMMPPEGREWSRRLRSSQSSSSV